jgi:hypothetical protein
MAFRHLIPLSRLRKGGSPPRTIYLNSNKKTGYSINVPIVGTCAPTDACMNYCYGFYGPIAFRRSVARQVENLERLNYLAEASTRESEIEIDGIAYLVKKTQNFLRFFGVGDMTEASVKFINLMAQRHPDLQLWVSTKKLALVVQIVYLNNIHLMLSADSSTKPSDLKLIETILQERKGQAYAAWVQQTENEIIPEWVSVIFAQHKPGGNRAKWSADSTDPRICDATREGGKESTLACEDCRRCFDQTIRVKHSKLRR